MSEKTGNNHGSVASEPKIKNEHAISELRKSGTVTTTVTTRTVIHTSSYVSRKTISPGARSRIDRFYSQVDWDLAEEERELRRKAKRERRKAKRRMKRLLKAATAGSAPKRRAEAQSRIIDLLARKGDANA